MEDPNDPRPWKRLKREILRMIEAGVLEPGDTVAVTLECADFGIRYESGRKAFRELAEEGWLLYSGPNQPYVVAGNCHWPRCRLPDGSCDEARNCVN